MQKYAIASPLIADLIPPLLDWHRTHRRPLPWRENKDPYRIWLSEIMLQQTRIEAVIPYYRRFLSEAPTVAALAELDDERLMKLWEGLGYYSRARNLKRAAQTVVTEYGGELPASFSALRSLSGIGDYTAGAVSSIAFGLPEPAVDGNVLRVIMRLTGREDDVAAPATKKAVTEWLRAVYPTGEAAGALTEALMELGEQVCIPAGAPKCDLCPWQVSCTAYREGRQVELPKKSPKKEKRSEEHTVLILISHGKVALQKRPSKGLLAGLWGFPMLSGKQSPEQAALHLAAQGIKPRSLRTGIAATHIFTHVIWQMQSVIAEVDEPFGDFVWTSAEELTDTVALPTAFRAFREEFFKLSQNNNRRKES